MAQSGAQPDLTRSRKWRERRQAIVDVSAKVFAQRGYHATSTVELCEANDIGKGALYYYIGSKEQLLAAIHDRVMDEVILGADRVALAGGSPQEQLTMLGEELLDVIFRYPDHVWVFLHEFPALTGENAEVFRKRRRTYEKRIEAVFEEGSRSGHFRPLDPRLATIAWLGMHNYTYLWLRAGGRLSVKDVANSFADIFVRGVANLPAVTWQFAADAEKDAQKDTQKAGARRGRVVKLGAASGTDGPES
jgi:AcrR family transcriptional regulator